MKPQEQLRIPEVGEYVRSIGKLVKVEEIPQPTLVDYIFEVVEASIRSEVNGKHVDDYSTFNEIHGEGTAVKYAIEEAKKLHAHYAGALTFVVEKRTHCSRKRPTEWRDQECLYAKGFRQFNSLERGSDRDVPDDVVEIVWSSDQEGAI